MSEWLGAGLEIRWLQLQVTYALRAGFVTDGSYFNVDVIFIRSDGLTLAVIALLFIQGGNLAFIDRFDTRQNFSSR